MKRSLPKRHAVIAVLCWFISVGSFSWTSAFSAAMSVPGNEMSDLYYETCINGDPCYGSYSPLETAWWAAQEMVRQASAAAGRAFILNRFEFHPHQYAYWYTYGVGWIDTGTGQENGNGGSLVPRRETFINCPSTHAVGPDESGQCHLDHAKNLGPSMCPLGTNPIHAFLGNKYEMVDVIKGLPNSPINFQWHYNSQAAASQWRHSFDFRIESNLGEWLATPDSFTTTTPAKLSATMTLPDGRVLGFTNVMDWANRTTATSDWDRVVTSAPFSLVSRNDDVTGEIVGFELAGENGNLYLFDVSGRMEMVIVDDHRLVLHWDAGRLSSITDEVGQALTLTYDAVDGALSGVFLVNGHEYRFEYLDGLLVKLIYPDENLNPLDDPYRTYLYDDVRFPTHLTGIIDERGNRIATWSYDEQGRAVSSEHAGGVDNHSLVYNADGTTTVTDPQGRARTYSFTNQSGVIKIAAITGGDCAHCGNDAASYTYDSNGFVASKTDFNGHVTTYTRDTRGRELSRTEAAGTPEARTVSTTWHPALNKPLTITEPGRLTTYSYDPDGRLLTQTEQAQP